RWAPKKTFTQRAPDGKGGWTKGKGAMDGVRLVPYHLPELVAAKATANGTPWRVYIVEGEKDVDNLRTRWGLTATTNPAGAGKWRAGVHDSFPGGDVVIIPDNDEAGREHALTVARNLERVASSVRIPELQGLPDKADISDWIKADTTQRDLDDLVDGTQPYERPADIDA